MRSHRVAAVTLFLACAPVLLSAQSLSLGVGGLYAALNGSDFDGINAGVGVDAQFGVQTKGGVSVAGGFQYTSHGVDGVSENFGVRGFFAEVRYAFERASAPSVTPYLGARFALTHYGISSGGSDVTADGTAFGPTGGLLIGLTPTARLDIGVAWFSAHFGNFSLNGSEQPNSESTGSALAFRAGVVFAFGKN